jgi:hypothetical protein
MKHHPFEFAKQQQKLYPGRPDIIVFFRLFVPPGVVGKAGQSNKKANEGDRVPS